MRRTILTTSLLVILTLSLTQLATAQWKDNVFTNESSGDVYVAFTTYRPAADDIPLGWRTTAWYLIEPDDSHTFKAHGDNAIYYLIYQASTGSYIKPENAKTFRAWRYDPAFKIVSEDEPDTFTPSADLLYAEPRGRATIKESRDYFKSANTGSVTVTPTGVTAPLAELEEEETVDLPDPPETVGLPDDADDGPETDPSANGTDPTDETDEPMEDPPEVAPQILELEKSGGRHHAGCTVPFASHRWITNTKRFVFPGPVVSYTWRWEASKSEGTADLRITDDSKSGNTVSVTYRLWKDGCGNGFQNWGEIWVKAKYESTAAAPSGYGVPSLHSQAYEQDLSLVAAHPQMQLPAETALLPNYPNPFNPETWIPYHLSAPAEVTLRIYSADGQLVRTLALGHQDAGIYESKSRAAYWDGRNSVGERVASGLYFYTLTAGDFAATDKMLIMK